MTQLNFEVFYPHSPEQVWRAIANRRALGAWLMDNDFEPRLGHKFQFFAQALPGLEKINCQVLELDEPKRLVYSWQDRLMRQPSLVIWTLNPVDGGTQLKLEHIDSRVAQPCQPIRLSGTSSDSRFKAALATNLFAPINPQTPFPSGVMDTKSFEAIALNVYLNGGWNTALNSRLKHLLSVAAGQSDLERAVAESFNQQR